MLPIDRLRQETPATSHQIYLNNAGASLSPTPVLNRIKDYLDLEARIGGYRAVEESAEALDQFYSRAAQFINAASPMEIAFAESATHAWQKIFYSLELTSSDSIVLFENEYVSYYLSVLQQQKRLGFKTIIIGTTPAGDIDLEAFQQALNPSVKAVLLGHMPTQSGILNPAEEVGAILAHHSAKYLLDATQTVGQVPLDVQKIQCDALCATGRKFLRGPRGTGFLYVKEAFAESLNPVVVDLGSAYWDATHSYSLFPAARRFECWEKNYAALLGLSEAINYANQLGMDAIWERSRHLAHTLREGLRSLPGVRICDPGTQHGAIVTFAIDGHPCREVIRYLLEHDITINLTPGEYSRLDFEQRNLKEACRASPHYFNTEEEITTVIARVEELALELVGPAPL